MIEVEYVHVFQQIFDSLKKVRWIAEVVGARVEFSEDDGRHLLRPTFSTRLSFRTARRLLAR